LPGPLKALRRALVAARAVACGPLRPCAGRSVTAADDGCRAAPCPPVSAPRAGA